MPRRTNKDLTARVKPQRIGQRIEDALDPVKAHGKVKRWVDMTDAEKAAVTASMKRGRR